MLQSTKNTYCKHPLRTHSKLYRFDSNHKTFLPLRLSFGIGTLFWFISCLFSSPLFRARTQIRRMYDTWGAFHCAKHSYISQQQSGLNHIMSVWLQYRLKFNINGYRYSVPETPIPLCREVRRTVAIHYVYQYIKSVIVDYLDF